MQKISRRIYLDYAAGTPIDPRVLREMAQVLRNSFGNPASVHHEGVLAKKLLDESRRKIALVLGCHPDEIIFTGSGTEANNLAIFGVVEYFHYDSQVPYNKLHIITSAVEHSSVKKCFEELRNRGVKVTVVPVGEDGVISPRAVISALTNDTVLISVVLANNEIGTTQPIRRIALDLHSEVARRKFKFGRPIFHTDASQALCYINSSADSLRADLITVDGQWFTGRRGLGRFIIDARRLSCRLCMAEGRSRALGQGRRMFH